MTRLQPNPFEEPPSNGKRLIPFNRLIVYAACLGIGVGFLSIAYYFALRLGLKAIWDVLPTIRYPGAADDFRPYAWILTGIGGLLVGLSVHYLGAPTGLNEAVDEIHQEGSLDYQQTPGMIVASLLSLIFGSSAGPETPLVDINGSVGSWVSHKLKLSVADTRILTFCGMGAALGAFFGSPMGSALLALELPHRMGMEYYEALIPVIVSAVMGFAVFRLGTGQTIGGLYEFPAYDRLQPNHLVWAVLLGGIGAAIALLFMLVFRATHRLIQPLPLHPVLLTTLGGVAIGLLAAGLPLTLFYGEEQIQTIIDTGRTLGASLLLFTAFGKMVATSVCLNTGFRGGFLFPLFFIGASIGMATSLLIPTIPPTVGMICVMAAVSVAIMKTPVSIVLILAVISDTDLLPVTTVAAIVSFLLTTRISFFPAQRSRIQG
ncbi:chloride channel protein [Kovacikia minuta CCNUW1]|uniref:chloride channel protein n=1 Tax=Kovacikia minuta TaxID=2931930 RepID=UPI001CCEF9ED|nr:chloride channel protein [Kovacikia minuta]UBF26317.1 chloride channel protein [Kovacikia minuta CCNUW1]